jgi:hypothetical protein
MSHGRESEKKGNKVSKQGVKVEFQKGTCSVYLRIRRHRAVARSRGGPQRGGTKHMQPDLRLSVRIHSAQPDMKYFDSNQQMQMH